MPTANLSAYADFSAVQSIIDASRKHTMCQLRTFDRHCLHLTPRPLLSGMSIDLLDLLRTREIVHPSRITAAELSHRQLRVSISGYPWWLSDGERKEGTMVIVFSGVREGLLDVGDLLDFDDDEALDQSIGVSELSDLEWTDKGTGYAIYCTEPLPDPLGLYAAVEDYLWSVSAIRSARDYLNMPQGSLARFCNLVEANLYLVGSAPSNLADIIVAELQRRKVKYSLVATSRTSHDGLFVELGGSRFICDSATAEF